MDGRSRSTTPARRRTNLSTKSGFSGRSGKSGRSPIGSKFRSGFGKVKAMNRIQNSHGFRGKITTSITTSNILMDKGFTGPRFIEDDLAYNRPEGDEIPEYFAEDFDFSVPNPMNYDSEMGPKNVNDVNYEIREIMDDYLEDIGPDQEFEALKSKIIDVGKELNDLSITKVKNTSEDDIIEAVIQSNKKKGMGQSEDEKEGNLKLFFGHENWNLMMNMLIGFRAGLKMLLYKEELVETDFLHIVRHDIHNVTFSNKFDVKKKFIMYEYAPYVFSKIRNMIGFDDREYLKSIGPENILGNLLLGNLNTMREIASAGKSGSIFYLTHDKRFFVKTISKSEHTHAFENLNHYYSHLKRNPNTLICKITNLYKIETYLAGKERVMYICIMKNVFSDLEADITYDLKGSKKGRTSRKGGKNRDVDNP
jgi:predicted transposase YbfD/YdcC